jgi:transcriptional regulator with XRE-family HTH domain
MEGRGLSVQQLAEATDVVYETIRGIVAGDRPPSKLLLREICRVLRLDLAATSEMLITEQIKRKFDRVPARFAGRNQDLQPIEGLWPLLSPDEKEHIVWLVSHFAEKRDRKHEDTSLIQRIAPRPARTP